MRLRACQIIPVKKTFLTGIIWQARNLTLGPALSRTGLRLRRIQHLMFSTESTNEILNHPSGPEPSDPASMARRSEVFTVIQTSDGGLEAGVTLPDASAGNTVPRLLNCLPPPVVAQPPRIDWSPAVRGDGHAIEHNASETSWRAVKGCVVCEEH